MEKTGTKKIWTLILCLAMTAAVALTAAGCGGNDAGGGEGGKTYADGDVIGEGGTQFTLVVADKDGKESSFEVHTDKATVGDALAEHGMISGDEGEYGLYVKTVNGITADYDKDGTYWAFYIDGEYASTGVDATDVAEGSTYSLRIEEG